MTDSLHGERALLRAPQPSDVNERLQLGHHSEATRMYGGDDRTTAHMTRYEAREWHEWLGYWIPDRDDHRVMVGSPGCSSWIHAGIGHRLCYRCGSYSVRVE